jgi:hypothetical protein
MLAMFQVRHGLPPCLSLPSIIALSSVRTTGDVLLKPWGNATNRASIIASENPTRSSASLSEAKCHASNASFWTSYSSKTSFHPLGEKTVTYGPPWRQFDKARVGPKIVRRMVGMGALVKAFRRHKKNALSHARRRPDHSGRARAPSSRRIR